MARACFVYGGANPYKGAKAAHLIELQQTGFDRFTVIYGLQVSSGLSYSAAAAELGACIMHAQACEGHIDNRTRSEARRAGDSSPYFEPVGAA